MDFGVLEGVIGIIGLAIGFVVASMTTKKSNVAQLEEANQKADLTLKEAKLTAKRLIGDAESKADKIVSKAESKNESIKQKKIQEAKQKFANFKADFETYKADKTVSLLKQISKTKRRASRLK